MSRSVIERFEEKFTPEPNSGCWLWLASCSAKGYGYFFDGERNVKAHRWSYQHHVGPIPDNLVIDHICRVRCCVNPAHLEIVSNRENVLRGVGVTSRNARKLHCARGHLLIGDNLQKGRGSHRVCMECRRIYSRAQYQKKLVARNGAATGRETL